ncbi:ImmA/IrrE family metallo-endopeptidase [uncultured Actinomyces sp.]|uniref:helix-turn-helix domain-containing protein n=1 Tax=uncultured Actinomyces sp. TaxID=249061 RepID=UPI00288AC600|nr:ImmA/IrrE family metallo-endopeptidase [uncultured Actinomyces sp.]
MARAPINGSTLRWARETMFVERGELARAAGTSEGRIAEFETGDARPTLRQLENIANKLDRTLAFFFTDPPDESDVPDTADFRAGNGEPIPSRLAREMRRAEQHRDTVLELEGRPEKPALVGAINRRNLVARANEMRDLLGLTEDFTPPGGRDSQVLNFWRGLLERHGFLTFQTTKVELAVFRGLSIHHDVLPIILLNGADSNNGKVFTLFHEVAHLANRTNGMCVLSDDVSEESIANAFAANFLMPRSQIDRIASSASGTALERAKVMADTLKVSVLAAGVRLRTLDLISNEDLESIRLESDRRWEDSRESRRKRGGGPAPWRIRYRDLGSGYVGVVARALEDERVDLLDASYLMNARIPMAKQMIDEYHRTEGLE